MLTPILMAGGSGTRLWPLSRAGAPKQVHALLDEETLLQKTANRLIRGFGAERLWVTTHVDYAARIQKELSQLSPKHLSLEPARRETAPALGLALVRILKEDPDAIIVYANSDNYVRDVSEFLRILKVAEGVVRSNPERLALIGVRPTYPETGYGYIRMGDVVARSAGKQGEDEVFSVRGFVEKPDLKTAKRYLASWDYLWNPTLLVARAATLLDCYARHLPEMYGQLMTIKNALGTKNEKRVVIKEFSAIQPISLDYGILEKEKGMVVIPAAFGWTDVGSWRAVHEILAADPKATVARGPHVAIDSSANLIVSMTGKLVTTIGVHDMIVVETEDAILICPKSRAQEVKQ
ncbi:mannose-1-phosphate guanylyltransferase, partial [Patescibacteria group bacterium]|nr:mannose-1-phosphate guanylyltransferase [Patescibacteria group bacterium]